MKVRIIKVGRPAFAAYEELVNVYHKRIFPQLPIESIILKCSDEKDGQTKLAKIFADHERDNEGVLVILDERGKSWSSPLFAQKLQAWKDDSRVKTLTFLIGGPYGIPEQLRDKANERWCLSDLVFTSDIAWLVAWEQVYRALSILSNSRYHHGD